MSKLSGRSIGKRQSSDLSLGAIDEDSVFGSFGDDDVPSPSNKFTRRELFDNDLSVVDGVGSPNGGSAFIDLEAEERAFVSGSQQYLDAMETVKQLKQRLIRRTAIIDEIRKYYLRDVITIKHIMKDVLTTRERQQVLKMYDENLPSIDLKQALVLHAPTKCELQVSHCGECGGQLEIIMKDSDEVDMLKKTIIDCKDRESRFRIKLATLDAQIENTTREKAEASKSHAEEKKFLYSEMKRIKAEVEKVQSELSKVNKANKRAQSDNDVLQAKLNTLGQASRQLEAGTQEIESLRTELGEATVALKTLRQMDKVSQRELAERSVELKELGLKTEEQSEALKFLRIERDDQQAEIGSLKETMNDWILKFTASSEQHKASQERVKELEGVVEEQTAEHDKLLALLNTSDDDLKLELVELEDECVALKTEKKSLVKENEKLKQRLEKATEHKLVLEHDLAVAQHEIKQRDEELHSIQNFIHDKMGKQQSASSQTESGVPMKMEDVLHSIKAEARSRAGDAPAVSAKVASVKAMRQQEILAIAEAAAAAVLSSQSGSAPPSSQGKRRRSLGGATNLPEGEAEGADGSDDDIGNFDRDSQEPEDQGDDAAGAEKKVQKKSKGLGLRKARNVLKASMSGPSGEQQRARRKSIEASPVVPKPAAAKASSPMKKKASKASNTAKKSRSSEEQGGEEGEDEGHHSEEETGEEGGAAEDEAEQPEGEEHLDDTTEAGIEGTPTAAKKKKAAEKPKSAAKEKEKEKEKSPKKAAKSKEKPQDEDAGTAAASAAPKAKKGKGGGAKRRRSFAPSDAPARPGTGTTEPDSAPDSNPSSRASSRGGSRPSTRGSAIDSARRRRSSDGEEEESGADGRGEGSDGEGTEERAVGIATADSFDENDENEEAAAVERRDDLDQRADPQEGAAEEDQQDGDGDAAANADGADASGADAAELEDTVGFEGDSPAPVKASVKKNTKKPPAATVKKVVAPKPRAAKAAVTDDSETDGDRPGSREGSREGRRARAAPVNKKYTNSKEIKKEALEGSASTKQTRVKKQTLELNKEPRAPRKSRKPKLQTRHTEGEEGTGVEETEQDDDIEDEPGDDDGDEQDAGREQEDDDQGQDGFDEEQEEDQFEQEEEQAAESEHDGSEEEEEEEVVKVVAKAKKAPEREVKKVAAITVVKKKAPEIKKPAKIKVQTVARDDAPVSPLGSPSHGSAGSPTHSHAPPVIPLPKRRRSIPKSYSFSRHSMAELLGDSHSLHSAASNDSLDSLTLANAVAKTASKVVSSSPHAATPPAGADGAGSVASAGSHPISEERKQQLEQEFAAGVHRVPDPPSINDDDDLRDRAHVVKMVPIIPIEVKRYIEKPKPFKMPITTEEVVALEPLAPGCSAFEVKLRADLLKAMKSYPGAKESEAHKMINATNKTMHSFCNLYGKTIESAWTSLKANRGALDLHFMMKTVVEGMAACTEPKTGSVELAEVCKRILPVASLSPLGPAITLRWQEDVKLHETVLNSLLPAVDAATGKIGSKDSSDFFNTNLLDPTAKVAGAMNILIDKVNLAQESADQMQRYAADASKAVCDKLVVVLRDWAKVKNAFYEMDNKIAAEKEKVRKVLEGRIADLTRENAQLGVVCTKHEGRIRELESVEKELEAAKLGLKKAAMDLQDRDETITGLENDVLALQDETKLILAREAKKDEHIERLLGQVAGLEGNVEGLRKDIAQRLAELAQSKVEFGEVSEERDHFQSQYERMVNQEYSRLHKLVTTQMQCEPAVQDLAIQTEFVAPPMNLRTMVASKNARGKKAPLILSQSLEVPPSDPSMLTSSMVDTASSTFHPLSSAGTLMVAHGSTHMGSGGAPGSAGTAFPMLIMTPPSSQPVFSRAGTLSERSLLSVDTGIPSQAHILSSRESNVAANLRTLSREESFSINAADFLAAAPINYDLSSRSRVQADSIQEISRLLANNNDDAASVGSTSTRGYGNASAVVKKKAVKLARMPHPEATPSSGHYQHVHSEDKIPQWGTVHSTAPVSTVNINPGVVLGISGVGSIGGHTSKQSGFGRGDAFGSHNAASGGTTSTLSAAGSALLRPTVNNTSRAKGLEIEFGLPEVKVQSYNVPTAQRSYGNQSLAQQITNSINDAAYLRSSDNSRGSVGGGGLGQTTSDKAGSPEMFLMLDSPSLGGSSKHMGYDFERDRKQLLRIAGDLPPSQEEVGGIIYNHRSGAAVTFRSDEHAGHVDRSSPDAAQMKQSYKNDHSPGGSMMHSASQGSVAQSHASKSHSTTNKPQHKVNHPAGLQQDSAHSAVSGVSEDILKRLRKELLSR